MKEEYYFIMKSCRQQFCVDFTSLCFFLIIRIYLTQLLTQYQTVTIFFSLNISESQNDYNLLMFIHRLCAGIKYLVLLLQT